MNLALPERPTCLARDAHKGDAGRVLVLAGSREMPGAALLVGIGALRGGAGLVTVACFDEQVLRSASARAELVFWDLAAADSNAFLPDVAAVRRFRSRTNDAVFDVVVAGPGLGNSPRTRALLVALLEDFSGALVLDADALNVLADCADLQRLVSVRKGTTLLTPHPGEAKRLLGRSFGARPEERAQVAGTLARKYKALVCLKGASTEVAHPDGRVWRNSSGNPGMATAGAGDVLAGLCGALLCNNASWEAACAGVYWHGLAGDLAASKVGQRALLAQDLCDALGPAELAGPWA